MADFLHAVLERNDYQKPATRKDILVAFVRVTRQALVFPQSLLLENVDCDFGKHICKGTYNGQNVCVKLAFSIGASQSREDLLKVHAKEAILASLVLHDNILPIHGVFLPRDPTLSHNVCIISPWMENGDLLKYLENNSGNVSELERSLFMLDIISGLAYLHGLDIIHGNLRAKNVLISTEKRVLLTDFGASRVSNASRTGTAIGKSNWTALEVLNGGQATKGSDIWSYACTGYEVITGGTIPFFSFMKVVPLKEQLAKGAIPGKPDEVKDDDPIWKQLKHCWQKEPNKQPAASKIYATLTGLRLNDERPSRNTKWRSTTMEDKPDNRDAHATLLDMKSMTSPK
ncbi:RGS domain-containing serine/threonine-protein kinase A [Leucoagaricus sp. SymC.cos]|nr:RGS domain-containing serine/threonine-protein kinase A [Leucoagaricus sp. SymC.cos]